jgi:polysulfide reductase chain C
MGTELIHPIRDVKFLRPQTEWKWEVAIYLYLAGMGAGSYIIGIIINWSVDLSNPISLLGFSFDLAKATILWGPILVAIGAPFLILDLGIKRRFLYACLNPKTSWVARGFLVLSTFIVLGLVTLVISILPFQWLIEQITLRHILEIVSTIFALATAIYTGILLKSTKYVSLWNTPLLPLLFLISALSTGSMSIILSMLGYGLLVPSGQFSPGLVHSVMVAEQIFVFIEIAVLALYLYQRYRTEDLMEQGKSSVRLLLSGELRTIFWGGIVVTGFGFPIVLEFLYSHFPGYPVLLWITGIFLLVGGFFLRLGVISAGIKNQIPMQRLIEIQYNWRALQKNFPSVMPGRDRGFEKRN